MTKMRTRGLVGHRVRASTRTPLRRNFSIARSATRRKYLQSSKHNREKLFRKQIGWRESRTYCLGQFRNRNLMKRADQCLLTSMKISPSSGSRILFRCMGLEMSLEKLPLSWYPLSAQDRSWIIPCTMRILLNYSVMRRRSKDRRCSQAPKTRTLETPSVVVSTLGLPSSEKSLLILSLLQKLRK
jgi:hypothetical protein